MRVDLNKSVAGGRLAQSDKSTEDKIYFIVGYFLSAAISAVHLIPAFLIVNDEYQRLGVLQNFTIIFCSILFLIGLLTLFGILLRDKLFRIQGSSNIVKNKEVVKRILKYYFPKNIFIDTGDVWSSCRRRKNFHAKTYNRITIIYYKDSIYFNAEFFGDGSFQSPYHPLFYYFKFLRIKSETESYTKNIR
jgi:hypothetical protein